MQSNLLSNHRLRKTVVAVATIGILTLPAVGLTPSQSSAATSPCSLNGHSRLIIASRPVQVAVGYPGYGMLNVELRYCPQYGYNFARVIVNGGSGTFVWAEPQINRAYGIDGGFVSIPADPHNELNFTNARQISSKGGHWDSSMLYSPNNYAQACALPVGFTLNGGRTQCTNWA